MNEEQRVTLIGLLREMDAAQTKAAEEGDAEIAWFYFRDAIEDAMSLDRGTLDTYEDDDPETNP